MKLKVTYVLLILMGMGNLSGNGQVITYPTSAEPITRGLNSSLLTVKIDFPACTGVRVRINLGAINSPGVIEYVPGSVTKTAGTSALSIVEADITDLSNPEFLIGNTANGQTITFTIKRKANCGTASSTKDNIIVTSSGSCSATENVPNNNNYNLLSPALTFVPPPLMVNTQVGNTYSRSFSVTNGGLGCVDTLGLWIVYSPGGLQLNSVSIGATILTPSYTNPGGDSTYFKISGPVLGAGNLFCNNGSAITFTENFTVLRCDATTNYNVLWYAHDGTACQLLTSSGNLSMTNNPPLLTATLPSQNHNYCFRGESVLQKIRITNSGSGPATDIALSVRGGVPSSHESYTYPDTSLPWTVRNGAGDSIGVIRNFTVITSSFPSRTFYKADCSTTVTPSEVKGVGNANLIIQPGTFVTVDVYYKAQNLSCAYYQNCFADAVSFASVNTSLEYKNSCRTASYTEQYKNFFNRSYAYFRQTLEMPTDIEAGKPFELAINASVFRTVNKMDGTGKTFLAIAVGSTGIAPAASSVNIGSTNFPMTLNATNDTILIGALTQNINFDNSEIRVPLVASCGTGGIKTLHVSMRDQYTACAPVFPLGCKSVSTNLHCPASCSRGGATPVNFSLKRINYGLPDNDNNHIADASGVIDLTKIADHRSVNGDTLQGTWHIKITPNTEITDPNRGLPFQYVYIDFDLGANAGSQAVATLNALPAASIEIYPNSNPLAMPVTCMVSPTIVGTGGRYAHYQIGASCRGGAFAGNDSIVVKAKYTVNYYNSFRYSGNLSNSPTTFVTKNEVYSSYTATAINQIAPVTGQFYTCDHYNDYNQISGIQLSPYIAPSQAINGCSNSLTANFRSYTRSQEAPNVFPNELRTFGWLDTMRITLPPGVVYRPNSGRFNALRYNSANVGSMTATIQASTTGVVITQSGNILTVANIKTVYTTYGGPIVPPDEQEDIRFYFSVDPTCDATDGTYSNNLWISSVGNVLNTPLNHRYPTAGTGYTNGWIYTAPIPNISGGGTVTSPDGLGTWNIVLQNQSNTVPAANSYLYISPKNGFTNIVVREGVTAILPDANGFYRLANIGANSTRNLTITARTTTCDTDSMAVNYGWGCNDYPSSFVVQSCTKSVWLKMNNYPSEIQLTVEKQPQTPTIDFCATDYVEFSINSAGGGFADNPRFLITPPTGANIIAAQIEYPFGSGAWQTVTPAITAGVYTYRIEDHSGVQALWGTRGLPGVIDNPDPHNRKAKIRITYNTTCGFINNSQFMVQQQAERPCGSPLSATQGYNNSVRTNAISLTGVSSTGGAASFSVTHSASVLRCGDYSIAGSVYTLGAGTAAGDTIIVTIPYGLHYVAGSFAATTSPAITLTASSPVSASGGTKILKMVVPPGIASGVAIGYQFSLTPEKVVGGCGTLQVTSEYIRAGVPYSCAAPNYTCAAGSQSIIGTDMHPVTVEKGQVRVTNLQPVPGHSSWMPGITVPVLVTLANQAATAEPAGTTVEFYCEGIATPFQSASFPSAIPAGSAAQASINVNISGSCLTGYSLRAVVRPAASATQCVCDSSGVMALVILPVSFESFTGKSMACDVLLNWKVGIPEKVSYYIIEYSEKGRDFAESGRVKTETGQTDYSFKHNNPSNATYYRIKAVDYDGRTYQSNVITVNNTNCNNKQVAVYPNPAASFLTVELTGYNGNVSGSLYSTQGQIVQKLTLRNGKNAINITGILNGVYNLVVWDATGNYNTQKIRVLR
ncbi:MAG: T9SS type A sorting domain-containing protein [Chitinophagaceae bacterium]|nr:T9SS type A sorting domain-containing protein [Chitinophagaceae bacterium]